MGYEDGLEAVAALEGLGVIPYFALAAGFLTGKYRSEEDFSRSARGPGVQKTYWNDRGRRIVAALDELAAAVDATPALVEEARVKMAQLGDFPGGQ